jgi:MFS family permease
VLVVVALLVGGAAPLAGTLVDTHGERPVAVLGFLGAGIGTALLAIPAISLHGIGAFLLLIPVGLGLGMLFVPVSRATLNATPLALHGRASSILSFARLLGAAVGAGLGGAVLSGGPSAHTVHLALAIAAAACLLLGLPVAARLRTARAPEPIAIG